MKVTDVLTDPEIQRHTERILALQKEERQTREKLGRIIAAIGAELIAAKEALDKTTDKTAWQRWLKQHVHYSADTAQNYMRVARFTEKNRSASVFFGLDPTVLYRLAALPDEIASTRLRQGAPRFNAGRNGGGDHAGVGPTKSGRRRVASRATAEFRSEAPPFKAGSFTGSRSRTLTGARHV